MSEKVKNGILVRKDMDVNEHEDHTTLYLDTN